MPKVDHFERVYYKVIDYDTNEVLFEKEYVSEIIRRLKITTHHLNRSNKTKKGYYSHKKTGKNYKFIKLENEI
jgi:hypothetical protein